MSKCINVTAALVFYDGVQVFDATDAIGGRYIGLLVDGEPECDCRYMVVGVSPASLRDFRLGQIDLRSLVESRPEPDEWFTADVQVDLNGPLTLQSHAAAIPEAYLPESGFFLYDQLAEAEIAEVRDEALARQKTVVEIVLESPETAVDHSIRASKLGGLLLRVQNLLRNAYAKKIELLNITRSAVDRADAPLLDVVVPARPGSFRVVLAASQTPNLWGGGDIAYALDVMDDIMSVPGNPEETLDRLRKYRGRTVGSYLGLLKFIAENGLSMRYAWTEPSRPDVSTRGITRKQAEPLVIALEASEENLSEEKVILIGRLGRGDTTANTWRLTSIINGKVYTGKTRPGISVQGLKLGEIYKFTCEEVEEVSGTGRTVTVLYLIAPPEAGSGEA